MLPASSRLLCSAVFAALLSAHAHAITEDEFLASLTASHPAFIVAASPLAEAVSARAQAGLLANPALSWATERPDGAAVQDTLLLAWALPIDGRRGLAVEAAEESLTAARRRAAHDLATARLNARAAYATWYAAAARRSALTSFTSRLEELVARTRRRAEAGEMSGLAARRLEIEAMQARAELAHADAEDAAARARVLAWLPSMPANAVPERPPLAVAALDGDTVGAGLAALEADLRRVEAEVRLARRVLSSPTVELGWTRLRDQAVSTSGLSAALTVTLPLADRRQADRIAASGRLQAAAARLELARRHAGAELEATRSAYERLAGAATAAARDVAGAELVATAAEAAFEAGEGDVTDLLDSLRAVLAARHAEQQLHAAALSAAQRLVAASAFGANGGVR